MTDTHPQVAAVPANAQSYAIQKQQQSQTQEIATEPALEVVAAAPELQSVIEADETIAVTTTADTTDTATTVSTSTSRSDIASSSQFSSTPSRLSIAFQRISNGCGLCFHPLRNNNPTDYHALVVTPSDEDAPLPGQDYDHHTYGSEPVPITEDVKGDLHHQHQHDGVLGASSSMDHHLLSAQGAEKERSHNETQEMTEVVTSTEYDEITVEPQQTLAEEIVVLDKSLQESSSSLDTQLQQQAATPVPEVATVVSKAVETSVVLPSSLPTSPTQTRSSPFAKFAKRSSSMSSPSSPSPASLSPTSSSPSSSAQSSPLLGRLGRFAKKIRSNDTDSPLSATRSKRQSKIESSSAKANAPVVRAQEQEQVVPSVENISTAPIPEDLTPAKQAPHNVHVEVQETVLSDDDDESDDVDDNDNDSGKMAVRQEAWSAMPPLPTFQQQQQRMKHKRRGSLALDSAVLQTLPVTIPGQSQSPMQSNLAQPHTWTHSESTTLHTADASTGSGQSLSILTKTTRASTMDSSEVGSVNSRNSGSNDGARDSQKDSIDGKKRRKSVLKKLGKMININKEGKPDKKEKRVSRQESLLLSSPIEADEHEIKL
ncbi:hypothetical protein BG011_004636 [Mortierella polycephala]|uniref:Uncharacterized protein n=1 Tax=Mortierella polycephala TaxID=41804 RepID=A0A9P6Q0G8_9FUNG|nr:hypothetical protein BG011_004636 [Mortierella polycephala]